MPPRFLIAEQQEPSHVVDPTVGIAWSWITVENRNEDVISELTQ